jgi:hypothetical protein
MFRKERQWPKLAWIRIREQIVWTMFYVSYLLNDTWGRKVAEDKKFIFFSKFRTRKHIAEVTISDIKGKVVNVLNYYPMKTY